MCELVSFCALSPEAQAAWAQALLTVLAVFLAWLLSWNTSRRESNKRRLVVVESISAAGARLFSEVTECLIVWPEITGSVSTSDIDSALRVLKLPSYEFATLGITDLSSVGSALGPEVARLKSLLITHELLIDSIQERQSQQLRLHFFEVSEDRIESSLKAVKQQVESILSKSGVR